MLGNVKSLVAPGLGAAVGMVGSPKIASFSIFAKAPELAPGLLLVLALFLFRGRTRSFALGLGAVALVLLVIALINRFKGGVAVGAKPEPTFEERAVPGLLDWYKSIA